MSYMNLTYYNFSNSNLTNCNLTESNLLKSNFTNCNLYKANLTKCNLYKVNLTKANFKNTILTKVDLRTCIFNKTKFNIPRKYIDEIYLYLIKKALIYDSNLYVIICGSYRRLKPTSNDIDILIYHNNIKTKKGAQTSNIMTNFIKLLVTDKFIVDNYTSYNVPTKFMGLCKYKRKDLYRIDIRLIPLESIHPAML